MAECCEDCKCREDCFPTCCICGLFALAVSPLSAAVVCVICAIEIFTCNFPADGDGDEVPFSNQKQCCAMAICIYADDAGPGDCIEKLIDGPDTDYGEGDISFYPSGIVGANLLCPCLIPINLLCASRCIFYACGLPCGPECCILSCEACLSPAREFLVRQEFQSVDDLAWCDVRSNKDFYARDLYYCRLYDKDAEDCTQCLGLWTECCKYCTRTNFSALSVQLCTLFSPVTLPLFCCWTKLRRSCGIGVPPLHRAILLQDPEAIQSMNQAVLSNSAKLVSKDFDLPIHLLCSNSRYWNSSNSCIHDIIVAYPQALQEKNFEGLYPLQMALRNRYPLNNIRLLVQEPTGHAAVFSSIKYALENGYIVLRPKEYTVAPPPSMASNAPHGPKEIERAKKWEDGKRVWDQQQQELVAKNSAILALLFAKDVPTLVLDNVMTPSWFYLLTGDDTIPTNLSANIVSNVFDAYSTRDEWRRLAYAIDSKGRRAIDVASVGLRSIIYEFIFLLSRYEIDLHHIHFSATAAVYFAEDHGLENNTSGEKASGKVALKFMKNQVQFEREVSVRERFGLSSDFVVSHLRTHLQTEEQGIVCGRSQVCLADGIRNDGPLKSGDVGVVERQLPGGDGFEVRVIKGQNFCNIGRYKLSELRLLPPRASSAFQAYGLGEYPYLIVMDAGDRTLKRIIDADRIAGQKWDEVRDIFRRLVEAVGHIHSRGLIHADLKPFNVLQVGSQIKLIDFDAATPLGEFVASKWSSAFLPPELFYEDDVGNIRVRQPGEAPEDMLVPAAFSFDIWSLGCILYQLASGEPLFLANYEDNLTDQTDLRAVFTWGSDRAMIQSKLSRISNTLACNLVSQLLHYDPKKRPASAEHILAHPFITGQKAGRLVGDVAEFDVFLSYRVDADADYVEKLHNKLVDEAGLKVFWDKKSLRPGVNWEIGFCDGLVKSRVFVPVLSKDGLKKRFEDLKETSNCDNVYLEHRLALELHARGLVERVFPIFLGVKSTSTGEYGHYFKQGCAPSPPSGDIVSSVEVKLREHLDRQGLGSPLVESANVKAVFKGITDCQGWLGEGVEDKLLCEQLDKISEMLVELKIEEALDALSEDSIPASSLVSTPATAMATAAVATTAAGMSAEVTRISEISEAVPINTRTIASRSSSVTLNPLIIQPLEMNSDFE